MKSSEIKILIKKLIENHKLKKVRIKQDKYVKKYIALQKKSYLSKKL